MKAELLPMHRVILSDTLFAELVLWQMPRNIPHAPHNFRYRLTLFREAICVLQYDGETGKGDRRQVEELALRYAFSGAENLLKDFQHDVTDWIEKHSGAEGGRLG